MRFRPETVFLSIGLLLGGCEAGPNFVRPAAPSVSAYTPEDISLNLAPGNNEPAQTLVTGRAIPQVWYKLFHAPVLDGLVRQAITGNPTIAAAQATLAEAQQAVLQARGAYYPQLDFTVSAERQRGPPNLLGQQPGKPLPTYSLYTLGPLASFSPDVFGATARRVEQQVALARYRAYELAAAQLTLTGTVVTEALTIASDRAQVGAVENIIADDKKNVAFIRKKFAVGRAPRTDVLLAESQLANDRALLPPLRQQQAMAEGALTTLAGKYPAQWSPPAFTLTDFTLPARLPVSIPSALVHHRPDILAAEAELHASSAAIGVAVSQTYPTINLSASLASAATDPGELFKHSGIIGSAIASLAAPLFHGGALKAQKQGAIDAFRASAATYRQVVVQAFGQVSDSLRALDQDARLLGAEHQALLVADASLAMQRLGYKAGRVDVLKLLDAERTDQQAHLGYTRALAQRYLDTVQLFVAMGGGWSERRAIDSGRPLGARTVPAARPSGAAPRAAE